MTPEELNKFRASMIGDFDKMVAARLQGPDMSKVFENGAEAYAKSRREKLSFARKVVEDHPITTIAGVVAFSYGGIKLGGMAIEAARHKTAAVNATAADIGQVEDL